MIGTPIRGTLWNVCWAHDPLEPTPAGAAPAPPVTGESYILTADPTGSDLFEVTRAAILNGRAKDAKGFSVTFTKRLMEVRGTAISGGGNGGN